MKIATSIFIIGCPLPWCIIISGNAIRNQLFLLLDCIHFHCLNLGEPPLMPITLVRPANNWTNGDQGGERFFSYHNAITRWIVHLLRQRMILRDAVFDRKRLSSVLLYWSTCRQGFTIQALEDVRRGQSSKICFVPRSSLQQSNATHHSRW